MKNCKKCGFTTEDSEIFFCMNCGNKMTETNNEISENTDNCQSCRSCGFVNKNDVRFCIKCGSPFENKKVDLSKKAAPIQEEFSEKNPEILFPEQTNKHSVTESADVSSGVIAAAAPKKGKGRIIAVCSAVAALIAVGVIAFVVPRNEEDKLSAEVLSETMSVSDTEKDIAETMTMITMTTMTETVSETAAETTSATATVKETTVTETEVSEEEIDYSDERPSFFSFSGGNISLTEKNRYFFNPEYEYYVSYCGFKPQISLTGNSEAALIIENELKSALGFDESEMTEINSDYEEISYTPQHSFGNMIFEKRIEQVYCENGLLFVTIGVCSDYGGGTSSSILYYEDALIFNTVNGEQITLNDLITDKQSFLNAVNGYMEDQIYYNTYGGGTDERYKYSGGDYDAMLSELKNNDWLNGEWDYDGNTLNVIYHYIMGGGYWNKITEFNIPKEVWSAYVDISLNAKADYSNVDSLGKKIMSGNTAGNYCNYSAYSFDNENIYFAGGVDGYSWRPYKAYIGGSYEYGTELTDDMTDAVIVDGDTVYYRNASDGYKLYSIGKKGSERKKVTDYKVSSFRLYDGKIYFTSDDKLYRINKDGSGKTKILDKKSYDLQIYDDRIYTKSSDSSSIMYYDMNGNYIGEYYPMYYPIKQFFVSEGYCVVLSDTALSLIDVDTGYETYYNNVNGISINEDRDNFLIALYENSNECLYRIPKSNVQHSYYVNDIIFWGREFYTAYNSYGTYIYTLDKDGAASCRIIFY